MDQHINKANIFLPILILVWIASIVYMHSTLMRGWVPHDEGALAQAAERVLQGELPHRDFDDIYTGGLALLDAVAFRALGTSLASLRWAMLLFFAAWVPAIYYIASRFASPLTSAAVTLLCVAWSVPNYASPIPSWYNLFFAVFGAASLMRYLEKNQSWWLVMAGMCGGLSCLAKITGLYYIAAILLFFVFREQTLTMESSEGPARRHFRFYPVAAPVGLSIFLTAVLKTLNWPLDLKRFIHFELPSLALIVILLWREARIKTGTDKQRFTLLLKMSLPFVAGVLVPISAFLIPYIVTHSVQSVINGVFVIPGKRLNFAAMAPNGFLPTQILATLALVALLYGSAAYPRQVGWRVRVEFFFILATAIIFSSTSALLYRFIWSSVTLLIPVTVIAAGTILFQNRGRRRINPVRQQQLFMLSAIAGLCSLVQFPYSHPIYFFYVTPLLILAILAVIASRERQSPIVNGALLLFYMAFAVIYITPGFMHIIGVQSDSDKQDCYLGLPCFRFDVSRVGNLKVSREIAVQYQTLIPLVRDHAKGQYIYAAPDCPEVYYLSGFRNPTRTLFDFLDESSGRTQRIMEEIDAHAVNEVVLASYPEFSPAVSPDLREQLELRFTNCLNVGRFQVRWKE
jgi:hypothetical protein